MKSSKPGKVDLRRRRRVPEGVMSIAEFADKIHRSHAWVRALVAQGRLVPAGRTENNGTPFFTEEQVASFSALVADKSDVSGRDTAIVFKLLREEKDLLSICEQTALPPWKIELICYDRARLAKGLFVRGDFVAKLEAIAEDTLREINVASVTKPEQILAILEHERRVAASRVARAVEQRVAAERKCGELIERVSWLESQLPKPVAEPLEEPADHADAAD